MSRGIVDDSENRSHLKVRNRAKSKQIEQIFYYEHIITVNWNINFSLIIIFGMALLDTQFPAAKQLMTIND